MNKFRNLAHVISSRRTEKVKLMNGNRIPNDQIEQLLQLADCAPTHGRTEPWRFFVYGGEGLRQFCEDHADIYWKHTDPEKRTTLRLAQLKENYKHASHLVIVVMNRTPDTKIPEKEEYAACCAAIQNILLGAEAMSLSSIWSTGGMAYSEKMKSYLGLKTEDQVVGFIYLGFTDEAKKKPGRKISLAEKTNWYL